MSKLRTAWQGLFLSIVCATSALAQSETPKSANRETTTVTAYAMSERERFTAPSSFVQFRLQVYSDAGQVMFDSSSKDVFDWSVQAGSGSRLPDRSYLCVVTVKTLNPLLFLSTSHSTRTCHTPLGHWARAGTELIHHYCVAGRTPGMFRRHSATPCKSQITEQVTAQARLTGCALQFFDQMFRAFPLLRRERLETSPS